MPDISFDDLDTFGAQGDYKKSNSGYRQGNRTKKEWGQNLSDGVKRQVRLGEDWFDLHQKVYPDFPVEFLEIKFFDRKGELDEGDRRDTLDAILRVRLYDKTIDVLTEFECVEYNIPFARIKQTKIKRNLGRGAPLVHGQTGYGHPKLFIFSPNDLAEMDHKENYMTNDSDYRGKNPDGVYDGNPYYKLNVNNTSFEWIDFSTLFPIATYKVLIKKLLSRKTKGA